jgi:hypothetical protein
VAAALVALAVVLGGAAWWIGSEKAADEVSPAPPDVTPAESAGAIAEPVPPEKRPRPAATAILRVQGEHSLREATLSVYADGALVQQIPLRTGKGSERFSVDIPVAPGAHVISITVREAGGRTERQYIEGSLRDGRTRALEVTLGGWSGLVGRGGLRLRWVE